MPINIREPQTYDLLARFLDNGQSRLTRRIASNTEVHRLRNLEDNDFCYGICLYNTYITVFKSNGDIILNSGGHKTILTKARMNRFLPRNCGVLVRDGVWRFSLNGSVHAFQDNMRINALAQTVIYKEDIQQVINPLAPFQAQSPVINRRERSLV